MEVELIIRAPNQMIEDQVIHCNLDWTVHKLKKRLSKMYPSKPVINDQRLIYSGQLLHDDLCLRDVIRYQAGQSSYILHLVCSTLISKSSLKKVKQVSKASQKLRNHSSVVPPICNDTPDISSDITTQDVSQDRNDLQPPDGSYDHPYTNYANHAYPFTTIGDNQYYAQMAMMQQMYAQYLQHLQNMNTAGYPSGQDFISNGNNQQRNENAAHALGDANIPLPPERRAILDNDDEYGNRDFLDYIFHCCRFLLFFSIVYYYSTPERLLLVVILGLLAFFICFRYHEGWFMQRPAVVYIRNARRNRINNRENPDGNNTNERSQNNQNAVDDDDLNDAHEIEAAMDGDDPPHVRNDDRRNNSVFSPFTIISSFFLSLIPEPPPPVNIN